MNFENFDFTPIIDWLIKNGINLIVGILLLIIGLWIIKILTRSIEKLMKKRNLNPSLVPFLRSLFSITLKTLLIITVMSMVGIRMTSFIAILGAAGLAIGMALSGTLQNFAGGVLILILKPFKVGDYITAQGHSGTVSEIQIFNTILKTPDNKTIIIPNGGLSTSSLINYSVEATRRIDFVFGIGYDDDIDKAKTTLLDILNNDERILKDPAVFVALGELADSSVNFTVRAWVHAADYWNVHFDTIEKVKKAFDKQGITIPYPQTDLHIYNKT
jgi:small conductance mechanosensitive channel